MPTETTAERSRRSRLKRLFNITPEEYDCVLAYQGGMCFICESPPGKTRLAVDHDHATGLVRGLLCWRCNSAVAKLRDDVDRARRAHYYLRHPPFTEVLGEARYGRTGRVTTKTRKRRKSREKTATTVRKSTRVTARSRKSKEASLG
jgi:hypothetical protein